MLAWAWPRLLFAALTMCGATARAEAAHTAEPVVPVAVVAPAGDARRLVRVDFPALTRAVGEGTLQKAVLHLVADRPVTVRRTTTWWDRADRNCGGHEGDGCGHAWDVAVPRGSVPATGDGSAAALDVTADVASWLDGETPAWGWIVEPASATVFLTVVVEDAERAPDFIAVAPDQWNFLRTRSGEPFVPVGVNYFCPQSDALMEDLWDERWDGFMRDFAHLRALGLRVLRVHLQYDRFQKGFGVPDERALTKLDQLVRLARRHHLVLDVTGLSHYRAADVPGWFAALDDEARIAAEEAFWDAIVPRYANDPTIFCWDLQNEPFIPFSGQDSDDVYGEDIGHGYHYSNAHFGRLSAYWTDWVRGRHPSRLALFWAWHDSRALFGWQPPVPRGFTRNREWFDLLALLHSLARAWTARMAQAVRGHDPNHLVTIGMLPWSMPFHSRVYSPFGPPQVGDLLDLISIHVYPHTRQDAGSATLRETQLYIRGAWVGRPVLLEEVLPELDSDAATSAFYRWTLSSAAGWLGFYFGPPAEPPSMRDALRTKHLDDLVGIARTLGPPRRVERSSTVTVSADIPHLRAWYGSNDARAALLERFSDLTARGEWVDVQYETGSPRSTCSATTDRDQRPPRLVE